MRLKSLELQGFKSFPDKTLLSFPHPITAIVGPNGSGKSNLSDAIRWVLGEQSARSLRGGKMEDVIFGGAQDRRRQGFAQVTLTLEQCQDLLPDGGQEVAVTRRYYRSGESEYAINGTAVRLRDVNELFMDTGLGQEGYALIGQGKIDEILSAKSTQRREIFEEAAGISHCRHQKEETQRKLERTQENLLRIGDKLEELELQRTPLQAQAEQAQTYLALREELRVLEISLWMDQLDQQRAKSAALEKDLATARQELESCSVQADQLYAKGETLLQQLRDQQAQAEALRAQFQDNEAQLRDNRQRVELLRDRVRANEAGAQRTQADLAQQQSRQRSGADLARQQAQRPSCGRRRTPCKRGWRRCGRTWRIPGNSFARQTRLGRRPFAGTGRNWQSAGAGNGRRRRHGWPCGCRSTPWAPGPSSWRRWPSTMRAMEKGSKPPWRRSAGGISGGSSARWVSSFVSHPGIPWPWRLPWAGPCRTCW
ncbi:MAG: chromosome segregation SMC family protein [Evtepia gabavorous]